MNLRAGRAGVAERVIKGVAYQLIGSFSWRKKEDEKSIKAFAPFPFSFFSLHCCARRSLSLINLDGGDGSATCILVIAFRALALQINQATDEESRTMRISFFRSAQRNPITLSPSENLRFVRSPASLRR